MSALFASGAMFTMLALFVALYIWMSSDGGGLP